MFEYGIKMLNVNNMTIEHQNKERELEDRLVDLNVHKAQRIMSIAVIECLVIMVSGVYQVVALKRFLV